ncbi:large conductance mechanosensitive channel protein MscL [Anaerofustis sp. NSJ-163]|uniref:large conductance mechanosensitive channel protein MscL n=1 Tax=Anaerofustis sp. NSJ-163 TaxID=2944391 RepID=UPI00209C1C03|nr:large conductance mechanosensitive channel protein MscL [Anaerofustis sp. NSJ-163]MCO8193239.1 large conductance mechanosensitive channel protein MscL [Anaerofustis sp. NSJ-163]
MKQFLNEFKEFALRGNVMDLAVGVIIGGAFQAIINSLVKDIISPIIGLFARTDFSDMVITVLDVQIRYGSFITAVINFLIMAFIIFIMVKMLNKLASIGKKQKEDEAPKTKKCPYCLSEIPIEATKCAHCTSDLTE